jgi:hypothetical protein
MQPTTTRAHAGPVTLRSKPGGELSRLRGSWSSFLTRLCLLALWRTLSLLSLPLGKLLSLNLWLGRSALVLGLAMEHQVLKAIAWLSTPALQPSSKLARSVRRNTGGDLRHWHLGLGERGASNAAASAPDPLPGHQGAAGGGQGWAPRLQLTAR